MARKPAKEKKKQLAVYFTESELKTIDKIADELNMTRSHLVGNLVRMALDDAKLFQAIGINKLIGKKRKLAQEMEESQLELFNETV